LAPAVVSSGAKRVIRLAFSVASGISFVVVSAPYQVHTSA